MNSPLTKIFIFTLPQKLVIEDDKATLFCNIVLMPRFNPLALLANKNVDPGIVTDFVPFAESDIQLTAFLVKGNELLPTLEPHDDDYKIPTNILPGTNTQRTDIFTTIGDFFTIKEEFGREDMKAAIIKKYLPETYRNAYGFAGTKQGAVTDDSYFCALKADKFTTKYDETDKDTVNWAQVMSFCLHQPKLAKQLGMLYEDVEMILPVTNLFSEGGWVYADLKADPGNVKSYTGLPPEFIQRYAAWIPAITATRDLFSPVLFPVEAVAPLGNFDDVFDEVLKYSDGYAKIVHASQPVSTNHLDETAKGTAPVKDMGIRLAWDDEQVLEWYNRGFQSLAKIAGPVGVSDTPLVVSKYRLDVAKMQQADILLSTAELEKKLADSSDWKSQVSVTANNLKSNDIDLGSFDTELGIQVAPAKHGDLGDYWLPAYFTNWNGTCLCIPDPLPDQLNQLDAVKKQFIADKGGNPEAIPEMMFTQKEGDKLDLKYGDTYAFRVRLSDISGGGPGPVTISSIKGERKIAIHTFKRFVAPQPPSVTSSDDGLSFTIERPRLNYPAILFTKVKNEEAIPELLLDRDHLDELRKSKDPALVKKSLREVSLPDPDVTQVEIVVEVKSLEMDREDSYNALNAITPKESFIFLYKTLRNFPAYVLDHDNAADIINLGLAFHDIGTIRFGDPAEALGPGLDIHSENGPLQVPTGRDIRLKIRSFCPEENPQYFASEESRYSLATVKSFRQDPEELEPELLLTDLLDPQDPLLSIFFRPQPAITAQFRQEQKMKGKGNQTDSDLLDRLAAATGLINKDGTLIGPDNVRIQFGCSAVINHSIAPDRSTVTFSSRDDFYHKWINVIQLKLNRDWTWDLLLPDSFKISREWKLEGADEWHKKEHLGGVYLSKGLNWQAMDDPDRSFTRLVFIDAFDPKPDPKEFPGPLQLRYTIEPQFKQVTFKGELSELLFEPDREIRILETLLPVTTKPAQVPVIATVGIALSKDSTENELAAIRYSETAMRNRYLWIEFEEPLADPGDMYFGRVLSYAPDPMLAAIDDQLKMTIVTKANIASATLINDARKNYLIAEQSEPPINLDPETIRVIRPGQVFDQSGMDAMQAMIPAINGGDKPVKHFLLPLPPGLYPDSEELFGFFTYEFRVGHSDPKKWSTAQGRFGSPLRLTGVQHPAPPMIVSVSRDRGKILVGTRHAQSYLNGKNCTPAIPRTDIYALLYAQVLQAGGYHYRNILLEKLLLFKPTFTTDPEKIKAYNKRKEDLENHLSPFGTLEVPILLPGTPPYAVGFWNTLRIKEKLRYLGISEDAPLSVLCIELMPRNDFHNSEAVAVNPVNAIPPLAPQDLRLDKIRILRSSRLCPVTETCSVT